MEEKKSSLRVSHLAVCVVTVSTLIMPLLSQGQHSHIDLPWTGVQDYGRD